MWLPRAAPACFACLLLSAPVVAGAVDPPGLEADFAAVCQTAFARAQRTYQAPVAVALPAFDLPPTGEQDALGMVYQESLKITARHALYDDHTLWLRPRPRGGVERDPLDLWYTPRLGQPYRNAPYRVGDFDYSSPAIVPPLPAVIPEAARVLTAVDLGRRLGASKLWPQVMYIGANGYLRATGLTALFGSSLRLTAYNVGGEEVKPRLTKLYAKALAEARVAFFGVLESEPFTACVQAVATPGFSSRIETRLKLYPRPSSKLPANARVSPLAISSMFWKGAESTPADPTDQAHDADHLLVCGQGAAALGGAVPATPADPDQFLRFGPASCFGLMQLDRLPAHYARYADAKYARRVNYWVDDLQSDEPFSVDLYAHGTTYEGEDNLVAFVELQNPLPPALNAADGTSVRYSLTANLTPPPVRGPGLAFGESAAGDRIGAVVAVAGDTLAVGAPGIEGRGVVYRPGLVHLFRHYAGSWTKEQEIAPADGAVGDFFGAAVALAGDTLVVGAPRVDAVYVFVRGAQGWVQQARMRGADAGAGAYSDFGAAVALSAAGTGSAAAPVLVIGAPYDGAPCDSGAAYVYRRRGDTWQREARLTAADPGCWDHFGQAVAVADTTVAVGAPGDDFDAPKRWEVGSVYLFQRKGGAWRPATKLFNAEGWAEFGRAVALSGPTLLVGAPRADGQGWDSEAGKAFVYSGAGDAWGLKQVLIPVDRQNGDRFGAALALTQDAAIVGSPTALGGRGAAYEFKPAGGSWQEAAKFTVGEGAGPGVGPGLGGSVATAGDTYAVGAPTASNQETTYPGAAFVFAGSRRADLVLDLGPKGLWRRLGDTTWSRLSSATAVSMVAGDLDGNGVSDLVIDRGSVGLSLALNGAPDRVLDARSARQLAVGDLDGDGRADLVADFGPDGISVWKNGSGWQALPAPVAAPATNLAVGDLDGDGHADLVADYGAGGLWARINETAWAKLHPAATEGLLIADIDGDGLGNLIANRGADEGVWVSRDHQWERLHSAAPRHMAAGDFDGNGRIDLAFDLGGEGIWLRRNDADWTRVYDGTADLMMTADLDGNGQSDLLLALDTAGTEVWMNNRTWQHLHDSPARFAVAGNFAR